MAWTILPAGTCIDGVEAADELLVAVAVHVAADDGAVEHVEGGKQRRGAMALVEMGHRPALAGLERPARRAGLLTQQPIDALLTRCHRHTVGRLEPARRATSAPGSRPADRKKICARWTCLCGWLRSPTIAASRARSSAGITQRVWAMAADSHVPAAMRIQ
jgi:hypothetical protein